MIEKKNIALCPCCMEEHEQQTCKVEESNIITESKLIMMPYMSTAKRQMNTMQRSSRSDRMI